MTQTTTQQTQRQKVIEFLDKRPGVVHSLDEIAEGAGVSRTTVSAVLAAAKGAGCSVTNTGIGMWASTAPVPGPPEEGEDQAPEDGEDQPDEAAAAGAPHGPHGPGCHCPPRDGNGRPRQGMAAGLLGLLLEQAAPITVQEMAAERFMYVGIDSEGNYLVVGQGRSVFRLIPV